MKYQTNYCTALQSKTTEIVKKLSVKVRSIKQQRSFYCHKVM